MDMFFLRDILGEELCQLHVPKLAREVNQSQDEKDPYMSEPAARTNEVAQSNQTPADCTKSTIQKASLVVTPKSSKRVVLSDRINRVTITPTPASVSKKLQPRVTPFSSNSDASRSFHTMRNNNSDEDKENVSTPSRSTSINTPNRTIGTVLKSTSTPSSQPRTLKTIVTTSHNLSNKFPLEKKLLRPRGEAQVKPITPKSKPAQPTIAESIPAFTTPLPPKSSTGFFSSLFVAASTATAVTQPLVTPFSAATESRLEEITPRTIKLLLSSLSPGAGEDVDELVDPLLNPNNSFNELELNSPGHSIMHRELVTPFSQTISQQLSQLGDSFIDLEDTIEDQQQECDLSTVVEQDGEQVLNSSTFSGINLVEVTDAIEQLLSTAIKDDSAIPQSSCQSCLPPSPISSTSLTSSSFASTTHNSLIEIVDVESESSSTKWMTWLLVLLVSLVFIISTFANEEGSSAGRSFYQFTFLNLFDLQLPAYFTDQLQVDTWLPGLELTGYITPTQVALAGGEGCYS